MHIVGNRHTARSIVYYFEVCFDSRFADSCWCGTLLLTRAGPCRYDKYAFDRMYQSAVGASAARGKLAQLTFLRMGNRFLDNWDAFNAFMARMRGDEA